MALYLDTTGKSSVAIAVCDRCRFRFALDDLKTDRDKPGLRVCDECNDQIDAWKLTPRATEDITLRYPRPDEPLTA